MSTSGSQKIGNYEVLDVIGHGGMGVVYKGIDRGIGRLVAIKMITRGFEENPDLLKRFYREAQSAGMLQHPNIVGVYELGRHEQNPYLVMEYIEGDTLAQIISVNSDYSLVEKLGFIIQACDALQYAHEHGVIHRDVKPANIMVLKGNNVKLLDFGIARVANETMTQAGQVIGTIAYMSPEQITGEIVDLRTDVFSMSVVAFELLTLTHPFAARETPTAIPKILHNPPLPMEALLPECPAGLAQILCRGMAKTREERYPSVGDLGFELTRIQETLKRQRVNEFVERASAMVEKGQLYRAKEILKEVITIDPQNDTARLLTERVQQALQKEHRERQIQLLRSRAEEAVAQKGYDEALACLDQVITLDGNDHELIELRANWQRAKEIHEAETRDLVDKAVREARDAMGHGDVEAARAIIVACSSEIGNTTELRQILRQIDKERTLIAEVALERAIHDVQTLLLGKQYAAIKDVFLQVAKHVPIVSPALQARFEELKNQVNGERETEQFTGYDETLMSVSTPEEDVPPTAVSNVLGAKAARESIQSDLPVGVPVAVRSRSYAAKVGSILLVVLLSVAATIYVSNRKQAPPPQKVYASISALPWGTVDEVVGADGKAVSVGKRTPVAILLPPGQYTIRMTGPKGQKRSDQFIVINNQSSYHATFEPIDVEKLLNAY